MNRLLILAALIALTYQAAPSHAQNLCGAIGNCAPGIGVANPLPRNVLKPSIGSFENRDDGRFGRYRYQQPDQQLNLGVQGNRPSPRVEQRRLSGSRTIYRVENLSGEHVDWCFARYKSYRARDNTYQPSEGARKSCVSPFSG